MTHQVHHLTNVQNIICLNDGRIQIKGSYDDLVNSGINMELIESQNDQTAHIVPQSIEKEEDAENVDEQTNLLQMSEMATSNFLLKSQEDFLAAKDQNEKQQVGLLSSKTYFNYFRIGGGFLGAWFCIFLFIVSQLSIVISDYWVSNWASLEEKNKKLSMDNMTFDNIFIYDGINSTNISIKPVSPPIFEKRFYYFYIYCCK